MQLTDKDIDTILAHAAYLQEREAITAAAIDYNDEIVSIEPLDGYRDSVDVVLDGNKLFYANGILTHNSGIGNTDVEMTDTSESMGSAFTFDLYFALVRTEELDELDQVMVKQLKNRYGDLNYYKRFIVGLDTSKMKFYDVEQSAQKNISDSHQEDDDTPVFDKSKFGNRLKQERKFNFEN
ncbi:MAG: hypothetical protein ACK41Z_09920 [Sediminibacterium sp.]